jgi:hypothetical protein
MRFFHELYEQNRNKKHIQLIDICEGYCITHQLSYDDTVIYFPTIFYLGEIDRWVLEERKKLEELLKEKEVQLKERKDGEFTNTRRILATYFLLKAAGKETRYGKEAANKTRVAEFATF